MATVKPPTRGELNLQDIGIAVPGSQVSELKQKLMIFAQAALLETPRTAWPIATDAKPRYQFPAAALVAPKIVSTSTDDVDATGTGAHQVFVEYLDEDLEIKTTTIGLNGQTAVNLPSGIYRVQSLKVTKAGSAKTNAGSIYVFEGTSTAGVPDDLDTTYGFIGEAVGRDLHAHYTVPKGRAVSYKGFSHVFARNPGGSGGTPPDLTDDPMEVFLYEHVKGVQRIAQLYELVERTFREGGQFTPIQFLEGTDLEFVVAWSNIAPGADIDVAANLIEYKVV